MSKCLMISPGRGNGAESVRTMTTQPTGCQFAMSSVVNWVSSEARGRQREVCDRLNLKSPLSVCFYKKIIGGRVIFRLLSGFSLTFRPRSATNVDVFSVAHHFFVCRRMACFSSDIDRFSMRNDHILRARIARNNFWTCHRMWYKLDRVHKRVRGTF